MPRVSRRMTFPCWNWWFLFGNFYCSSWIRCDILHGWKMGVKYGGFLTLSHGSWHGLLARLARISWNMLIIYTWIFQETLAKRFSRWADSLPPFSIMQHKQEFHLQTSWHKNTINQSNTTKEKLILAESAVSNFNQKFRMKMTGVFVSQSYIYVYMFWRVHSLEFLTGGSGWKLFGSGLGLLPGFVCECTYVLTISFA